MAQPAFPIHMPSNMVHTVDNSYRDTVPFVYVVRSRSRQYTNGRMEDADTELCGKYYRYNILA